MKIPKFILPLFGIAFVVTCLSVYATGTYQGYTGNVCETTTENPRGICYEALPKGGFPVPFLYDQGGITGEGRLDSDDQLNVWYFLIDAVIYTTLLWLISRKKFSNTKISWDEFSGNFLAGYILSAIFAIPLFYAFRHYPVISIFDLWTIIIWPSLSGYGVVANIAWIVGHSAMFYFPQKYIRKFMTSLTIKRKGARAT